MNRAMLAAALLVAAASWATADEVWLKGGGRIVGEVTARTPQSVSLDVGPGTVTVPMARVERIVGGSSRLAEFRSRASRLSAGDVHGWLALAAWADQNDMRTQAREAWQHVITIEPANSVAQQGLGNVWHGGQWMNESDALRAQGLVEYQGQWMTLPERQARVQEEAADAAARREGAIADARIAEAEARAREAEARAQAAEMDAARAADAYDDSGIPLDYVYGSGIGYGYGYGVGGLVPVQPGCCGNGRGHDHGGFHPGRGGRRHDLAPTPPQRDGGTMRKAQPAAPQPAPRRTAGGGD